MAETFRAIRRFLAPRWLTEGDGGLVGYSLDLMKDLVLERLDQGHFARIPQNNPSGSQTAPPDALGRLGQDRRVVRGLGESDSSYARRLRTWLDDRKTAGNPYALMRRLQEYVAASGMPSHLRTVDASGNWYSLAADGTKSYSLATGNWDWDGPAGGNWARFWVIFYPAGAWTAEPTWGNGTWGDGGTWGTTAGIDSVDIVQAIVADWKPAGTTCAHIIIALDEASFDPTSPEPDGTWGNWSRNNAGTQIEARLNTARYWDGS